MITYIMNGKPYSAASPKALLTILKSQASHSREMSMEDYIKKCGNILTGLDDYVFKNTPPSADDIVQAWQEIGILTEEKDTQHTHTISK
jgi:hypothetical protein